MKDGALVVEGRSEPVPLYEVGAVLFVAAGAEAGDKEETAGFNAGPVIKFRDSEMLSGRVSSSTGAIATVKLEGAGSPAVAGNSSHSFPFVDIPIENLKGFRLREVHVADDLFEADLKGPPPPKDRIYVRRQGNLLPVEGVFQSIDEEYLIMEYEGQSRKLKRQSVLGVIFAPIASRSVEGDLPAVFELRAEGRFPAYFKGIRGEHTRREVLFRLPGEPADSVQAVPVAHVRRVKFSSDRVLFLSSAQPVHVEEVPLLGTKSPFPWRKDQAANGGPILLGGKVYRKGIGVHSRSILEFDLQGRYKSFASVAGLDDSAGEGAGVTFRVLADGKEILKKDMVQGARPENLLLPMQGVQRLTLEVDYGEDGTDFGDNADWAEARVTQ